VEDEAPIWNEQKLIMDPETENDCRRRPAANYCSALHSLHDMDRISDNITKGEVHRIVKTCHKKIYSAPGMPLS
jgi:hypothetical protein